MINKIRTSRCNQFRSEPNQLIAEAVWEGVSSSRGVKSNGNFRVAKELNGGRERETAIIISYLPQVGTPERMKAIIIIDIRRGLYFD